ncbi:Enolase [Nosema bombycis CQ1]|uniref:phosphopyruvate hydratase n=2 Tax=Nosema bombycis TaxID=27978 RepID=R0KW39_NOSB1|nr:enolase-1 [Nosema bombycis]EOB15126.1 Enolase [Nosema bombycis CQ1]|eukprot:EOB15126.1 Enolase [Nosema bombycis CQ1]
MKLKELNLKIKSRTILSSRGIPTVEVELIYYNLKFLGSCPSGASVGANEAKIVLDGRSRYNGRDVEDIHSMIKNIFTPKILGSEIDARNAATIDNFLMMIDGTPNKEMCGANCLLPLSIAFHKLAAYLSKQPLSSYISSTYRFKQHIPRPHFNILNGGLHSGNSLAIQEIMIVFKHKDIKDNIENVSVFYETLRQTIVEKYESIHTGVGDEGGFAPPIKTIEEGIELIMYTSGKCKLTDFNIALDIAANSFYKNEKYYLNNKEMTRENLCDYYLELINSYPVIYSIEDPFAENDIEGWKLFSEKAPPSFNIVGDDLTVTNPDLVVKAGSQKLCNVLLVKPNQIGTVSETVEAIRNARKYNMKLMVSHRSGETEDTFISDFAVGVGAEYFKSGAPCRGERVSKYNQLIRLSEDQ